MSDQASRGDSTGDRARLRWLIVGSFGTERRETFFVGRGELLERLRERQVKARIVVPDHLGNDSTRTLDLTFPKLRSFTREAITQSVPLLHELSALRAHVGPKQILPGVERLVGRGRLYHAIERSERAERQEEEAAAGRAERSLDDVLASIGKPRPSAQENAARAVDIFIKATRTPAKKPEPPRRKKPARPAHDLLDEAIDKTVSDALSHPTVEALEAAWRGLSLLADQLPNDGDVLLEIADVPAGHELDALEMHVHQDPVDRPDAAFVVPPLDSPRKLHAYADMAEHLQTVCVVELPPELLGAKSLDELRRDFDFGPGQRWRQLRRHDSLRWVCAVGNRVLLYSDERPGSKRTLFGSPVWAIAALMTAAHRQHGSFAKMLAPDALLQAPSFWIPTKGRDAGMALPTAEFCSVRAQAELGAEGIVSLGSTRRGDELLVSAIPTAYVDPSAQSLPAQILIGRIVRVSQALVDELSSDASDSQVERLFRAAAEAYLFPGLQSAVQLDATVDHGKQRAVRLQASAKRIDAVSPFEIAFALPW